MTTEVQPDDSTTHKKLKRKKKALDDNKEGFEKSSDEKDVADQSVEIVDGPRELNTGPAFKSNVYVSDSLKSNLTGGNSEFSLLSVFDSKGKKSFKRNDGPSSSHSKTNNFKSSFLWSQSDSGTTQTWWKEPLFFTGTDDKRFEEGIAFIKRKTSDENSEEFKNTRREMKTLVRKKIKRTDKRNDRTAMFYSNKRKTPNHVIKKRNMKKMRSS